ncbi:MAG: hypothetical protein KKH22_04720 [Proteobacteria bacterium]|nr:hypothetical protein [Pseudomonadota bacterium]
MKTLLLSLLFSLLVFGCAQDVANRYYLAERYPEKSIEEVEILYEKPSRPFIVIADFQSRGEDAHDMRKKAARIGADAVIVSHLGGYVSTGEQWAKQQEHTSYYSRIAATAIKYTKEK